VSYPQVISAHPLRGWEVHPAYQPGCARRLVSSVYGSDRTDGLAGRPYARRMSHPLPAYLVARVENIRDVADDLTRELIRAQMSPSSAIVDLVIFVRTEAEAILADATTSAPSS
jgi:hypothetical protein